MMIGILQRYIAKTVILATGVVSLFLMSVLFLMMLLGEMRDLGDGYYSFDQVLYYVFMRLPNDLYRFSPLLILLGSIVGLSTLTTYRELAVMRAAGYSIKKIIISVFGAAMLLIATIFFVGESFAPNLSYRAEVLKENLRNSGQAVVTSKGVWFHVDNNFVYVQHVIGRKLLEGVTRYQFDDKHHLVAAYFAKRLTLIDNKWQMTDVVVTHFYKDRTKSVAIPSAPWNLQLNQNLLNAGLADPYELTLLKLHKFANYLEQNGQQAGQYRYEFWQRILQPLASLVMIFLAVPFVLGALSTATTGWRIVVGILMGFVFFVINALLGQVCVVFQVPPILAATIPILLFGVVSIVMFKKLVKR